MRHQGIRVAIAHAVLLLEPGDQLHVLGRRVARIRAFHSAMGRPYFASIDGT
jgi:hypothetical protein